MPKPIYKAQTRPYQEDINDLIGEQELAKGRGPDKQKRKARGIADHGFSQNGHMYEKTNIGGKANHNHFIQQDWNTKKFKLIRRVPKTNGVGTDAYHSEHSSFEEAVEHSKKHS